MRHIISCVLLLTLVFSLVIVPGMYAQATKDAQSGLYRLEGEIDSVDKDVSSITIRQHGKNARWLIVYNKDTSFSYMNKKASIDDVKEKVHVICLGDFNTNNPTLMLARRIELRSPKI
jgi:hypothetical protein